MRLIVRIPTPKGPRTISIPRLAPEDAALIGAALVVAIGAEFVLREDGPSRPMAAEIAARKRSALRLIRRHSGAA